MDSDRIFFLKNWTVEDYIPAFCRVTRISQKDFHDSFAVLPCACGDYQCPGWKALPNDSAILSKHAERYREGLH